MFESGKHTFRWAIVILILLTAFGTMPSFGSILYLIVAFAIMPMDSIRQTWDRLRIRNKWLKIVIIILLLCIAVIYSPK